MEELIRIGAAASALGVSVDTLRRWERAGRVSFERRGGQRLISSAQLGELLRARAAQGERVSSARNRLSGVVVDVVLDGVMAKVELACGPFRVVSLMSREAAEELGLRPGAPATAVMKSTSVIVER